MIADRLGDSGMVGKLVGEEQMCAVPGRSIAESFICLRDVLWHCKDRKQRLQCWG